MKTKQLFLTVLTITALLYSSLAWDGFASAQPLSERAGRVLYVKPGGGGSCTGSWENACGLQTALGQAASGDEIWVAEGIYKPTTNAGERGATFSLVGGLAMYGGFKGSETALDQRSWIDHPAILNGDIDGDGILNEGNVYNVITSKGITETVALDGFTITGGNANGDFLTNRQSTRGGGVYNSGSAILKNIIISGNKADSGGGIYSIGSAALMNVVISGNQAGWGGGMYIWESSQVNITNVIFFANSADYVGGGMINDGSQIAITNATFSSNLGGGIYNTVSNIHPWMNWLTVTNSIIWGNTESAIFDCGSCVTNIYYSNLQDYHYYGGNPVIGNISIDPQFVDAANGNLRLKPGSPSIDTGNNAASGLAGINTDLDGKPRFVDYPGVGEPGLALVDMGAYETQKIRIPLFLPFIGK